jgi:hypothetical protein
MPEDYQVINNRQTVTEQTAAFTARGPQRPAKALVHSWRASAGQRNSRLARDSLNEAKAAFPRGMGFAGKARTKLRRYR